MTTMRVFGGGHALRASSGLTNSLGAQRADEETVSDASPTDADHAAGRGLGGGNVQPPK